MKTSVVCLRSIKLNKPIANEAAASAVTGLTWKSLYDFPRWNKAFQCFIDDRFTPSFQRKIPTHRMSTITAFQSRHIALLCKCTGTSFISGSVNNGFFDNKLRSLITALVGVTLFIVGEFIDSYLSSNGDSPSESMWDTLLLSTVLSLGIGFFTGGLQHFPFPNAHVGSWVVPLGFVLTLLCLAWTFTSTSSLVKPIVYYALIAIIVVSASSWGCHDGLISPCLPSRWVRRHP
jgi:hypothetical protein